VQGAADTGIETAAAVAAVIEAERTAVGLDRAAVVEDGGDVEGAAARRLGESAGVVEGGRGAKVVEVGVALGVEAAADLVVEGGAAVEVPADPGEDRAAEIVQAPRIQDDVVRVVDQQAGAKGDDRDPAAAHAAARPGHRPGHDEGAVAGQRTITEGYTGGRAGDRITTVEVNGGAAKGDGPGALEIGSAVKRERAAAEVHL